MIEIRHSSLFFLFNIQKKEKGKREKKNDFQLQKENESEFVYLVFFPIYTLQK
jgi:hypothetical protein